MNIEEARKVLWLKSNHRPLGELLDEGYLNQSRLEWAAEKAYDPALKQAAKVILESKMHPSPVTKVEEKANVPESKTKGPSVEIGISLDKARSTIWPFSSHRGQPMGDLVDSKQLSLKDLVYAVETAWDQKVRQAAIALSLVRLNQVVKEPVPSAGFVHVVSGGRSYSERRQLRLTLLEGVVLGFVVAISVILALWATIDSFRPHPNAKPLAEVISSPAGIVGLLIALGIFLFVGWLATSIPDWITKRLDTQIDEHRLGQEGEEQVVQLIVQALDGNWYLFRNINLPGRNKGDLDIVLVGPPGVWVLEVKNFRGQYRNVGEYWEYKNGKKWKSASVNPSRQANNNAYRLKNFLKADNVNVFVNSAVVWANSESHLMVENPSVAVWRYNRLPDEIGNIWQGEKLSEAERNKIVVKLSKLCEQQRKSQ